MVEAWHAVPVSIAGVDNPMERAAVLPIRPLVHEVSNVYDEAILDSRHRQPGIVRLVVDLQAVLAGLLKQYGDGAEVCVGTCSELPLILGDVLGVVEELEIHHRFLGEVLEYRDVMTEAKG